MNFWRKSFQVCNVQIAGQLNCFITAVNSHDCLSGRPARQLLNKLMEMAQQLVSTSNAAATVNTKHLLGRCIAYSFAALLPIHAYSPHETTFILPLLCGSGRRGSRLPDQLSLCGVGAMMVKILKCYIETEEVYSVAEAASDLLKDLFRSDSPWRSVVCVKLRIISCRLL